MNSIDMTREELISYGYDYVNMLACSKEQGLEILQRGCCTVYLLYKDGTECVAEDPQEINDHVQRGGIIGVELDVVRTMEYALILNGDYDDDLKGHPEKIAGICNQVFGWKTDRDVYEGYMELVQTHKTAFIEKPKGCQWCTPDNEGAITKPNWKSPDGETELSLQFNGGKIGIIINDQLIGEHDINLCPFCGKPFQKQEEQTTIEWCSHCGNEQEIKASLEPQTCPECGEPIMACSYCIQDLGNNCSIKCIENTNILEGEGEKL